MCKVMMRYHRIFEKGQKKPVGLIAWSIKDDVVSIGWSLCHPDDQFVKRLARNFANQKRREDPITFKISDPQEGIQAINRKIPHTLLRTATYAFGDIYTSMLRATRQGSNVSK